MDAGPDEIVKLGELVRRLRSADPNRRVSGSDKHGYAFGPVLTEAEVLEFESENGVILPADYRQFLLTVGNGGAGPGYGLLPLDNTGPCKRTLSSPFPLSRPSEEMSEAELEPFGDPLDYPGFVVICDHGCCHFSNLVVCGPKYGTMCFCWEFTLYNPTDLSFTIWYRSWAQDKLRLLSNEKHLVPLIKVGMSKAEVIATVGGEWTEDWQLNEATWQWSSPDIPAYLHLDARQTVVEVTPSYFI